MNKTLSLWKAQSNALSRVSPSRWGVTKPDVVVLTLLSSEQRIPAVVVVVVCVLCIYIYILYIRDRNTDSYP